MQGQTFLSELMPLALCMKLLGWFPTKRVHNDDGDVVTEFELMTVYTAYSAVLTCAQLGYIVRQTWIGLELIATKPARLQLQALYFLLFRATPHLLPLLIILQCRSQVKFVQQCTKMQRQVEERSVSGRTLNFGHTRRKVTIKVCLILGVALTLITSRCIRLGRCLLEDVFLILGFVNEFLLFSWWHYAALFVRLISSHILREYQLLLEFNEDGKSGRLLADAVLDLRSPWLTLFVLTRESGNALSLALTNLFIFSFLRLLATSYFMVRVADVQAITMNAITFLISASILVTVCQTTHHVQREIYVNVLKALEGTKKLRIEAKSHSIITRFLVHLTQHPPEVTYSGYINVGRPLLTTIFSSYIAYITVILQFAQYEASISFQDMVHLYDYFYTTKPFNSTQ